jgi:hypothetical protein
VISGDNAVSVGAVASALGLHGDAMDARRLPSDPEALADTLEECTTFGRVRPDQKRAMVHALQSRGHTVVMTGDGVNDVLALKDADVGVAMGAGSPASRAVAQIVLLDNKFATLPYVVAEGRRETFLCYLLAYRGRAATPVEQTQASTSALITLLVIAVWVLAVVARPYTWWRLALVAASAAAYVAIFTIPLARETFMLDPTDVALTTTASAIGLLGAAIVEVLWWVQGAVNGDRRRWWR